MSNKHQLEVHHLMSIKDRTIGLLNSSYDSIYFTSRFGIHTFGLKGPITVIILDDNNKVIRYFSEVKPNRIITWNPKFNNVVETRKVSSNISVGDTLHLRYINK